MRPRWQFTKICGDHEAFLETEACRGQELSSRIPKPLNQVTLMSGIAKINKIPHKNNYDCYRDQTIHLFASRTSP